MSKDYEQYYKKAEEILKEEGYKIEKCKIIDKWGNEYPYYMVAYSPVHEFLGWEDEVVYFLEDGRLLIVNLFWRRVTIK